MMTIYLTLIGLLVGICVIALGGGGGAIYLGVLSGVFGLAPATAAATSILSALPSLIIGGIGYYRQGKIDFHRGNQMLLAAIPAVLIGSLLSPHVPKLAYQWLIAIVLVGLGVQMLVTRKKQSHQSNHALPYVFGVLSGLMVGVAGLSGGGPILAGLMILGLNAYHATATSTYVLVGMGILGAVMHTTGGQVDWAAGLPMMIGAILGAGVAPLLVKRLYASPIARYIPKLIAILLIVMGVKTVL
jgi:uncharacterized membrane protein YfcA